MSHTQSYPPRRNRIWDPNTLDHFPDNFTTGVLPPNAKAGKVAYKNKQSVKNLDKNGKTVKLYAVWKKK